MRVSHRRAMLGVPLSTTGATMEPETCKTCGEELIPTTAKQAMLDGHTSATPNLVCPNGHLDTGAGRND